MFRGGSRNIGKYLWLLVIVLLIAYIALRWGLSLAA
jgi:hypothetical protein